MKVRMTFQLNDDDRRLIARNLGSGKPRATRTEVVEWINGLVVGGLEDAAGDENWEEGE